MGGNQADMAAAQRNAENPNTPSAEQLMRAYETVYLLKWLFPPVQPNEQLKHQILNQSKFPNCHAHFNQATTS